MLRSIFFAFVLAICSYGLSSCGDVGPTSEDIPEADTTSTEEPPLNYNLHTFYYNWYGNPEVDTSYRHWAHDILPHWSDTSWDNAGGFPGNESIGADFYPALGCYSNNDPELIDHHMQWIREANIGTIVLSWWGVGSFEDRNTEMIMDVADKFDIKVAFHIEPLPGRTAQTTKDAMSYIIDTYGEHPAFYLSNVTTGYPLFYIYDSYLIDPQSWDSVLNPNGSNTIWDGKHDAFALGLWVDAEDSTDFTNGGFAGFYTYFASDGFTYGSTSSNWEAMSDYAIQQNLIFVPCVGPGYSDMRIRPWNSANWKSREGGDYYDRMFSSAIDCNSPYVGVTSFNEWHEGTQIEPAISKQIDGFEYLDYDGMDSSYYLEATRKWSEQMVNLHYQTN